jgi:hypothetical protein
MQRVEAEPSGGNPMVREDYGRLVRQPQLQRQSLARSHATDSQLMRHNLIAQARTHQAAKRGGIQHQMTLDEALLPSAGQFNRHTRLARSTRTVGEA